jgi:hypothetical protein
METADKEIREDEIEWEVWDPEVNVYVLPVERKFPTKPGFLAWK